MQILPIGKEIRKYCKIHGLEKKLEKQIKYLKIDFRYPSLEVELLEPKDKKFYSFRVDKKYRAIFVFRHDVKAIEILLVTNHYR